MSFIKTIDPENAPASVQHMYERQAQFFGYLPNYARAFSHRPELMSLWADLQRGIKKKIDYRLFELVTFAAAVELESSYCALAHGERLISMLGLTSEEVSELARGAYDYVITEKEAKAMRYARKIAQNASLIDASDVAALVAVGFKDEEVFDIAATAAARAFFVKLVDGLGTQPDSEYAKVDENLQAALTVGRDIAAA